MKIHVGNVYFFIFIVEWWYENANNFIFLFWIWECIGECIKTIFFDLLNENA